MDLKLSCKDSVSVFSKRFKFIFSWVDNHRCDELYPFCNLFGNDFAVCDTTGQDNCIYLTVNDSGKSSNIL